MNGWQRTLMNQVDGGGLGAGSSSGMPPWQPQMEDVVGLAVAADPQFVMLRDNTREKMVPVQPIWPRRNLKALARRLEEILFRKYPNKMEYYNMRRQSIPPALMFAIKTFRAQNRQYLQNQQSLRQIASSPGYGTINLTSNIVQGASENSGMSDVRGNFGALSSSANMIPQNANMDTSLPGAPDGHVNTVLALGINPRRHDLSNFFLIGAPDGHVNTVLSLGINPTRHDLSRASNNNQARRAPMKHLPKKTKFNCPICINEMVDASSTICGHIFCKKCIETSIRFQKKCPTYRRRLTMRNFHRIYLVTMD